jgi:hypothetical protein
MWDLIPSFSPYDAVLTFPHPYWAGFPIFIEIGLTSQSQFEWLQLDPRVLIRIDNYEGSELPKRDTVGICGMGGFRDSEFVVDLPDKDIKPGAIIPSDKSTEFDYYSLVPGERAVFEIHITPYRPGKYEFSLGIEYWFNGERQVQWTDDTFKVTVERAYRLYDWGAGCVDVPQSMEIRECAFVPIDKANQYTCETREYRP